MAVLLYNTYSIVHFILPAKSRTNPWCPEPFTPLTDQEIAFAAQWKHLHGKSGSMTVGRISTAPTIRSNYSAQAIFISSKIVLDRVFDEISEIQMRFRPITLSHWQGPCTARAESTKSVHVSGGCMNFQNSVWSTLETKISF
jgi:hypothetical protein